MIFNFTLIALMIEWIIGNAPVFFALRWMQLVGFGLGLWRIGGALGFGFVGFLFWWFLLGIRFCVDLVVLGDEMG